VCHEISHADGKTKKPLHFVLTWRILYKILLTFVKLSVNNARSPNYEWCSPLKQKTKALNISEVPIRLSTIEVFVTFPCASLSYYGVHPSNKLISSRLNGPNIEVSASQLLCTGGNSLLKLQNLTATKCIKFSLASELWHFKEYFWINHQVMLRCWVSLMEPITQTILDSFNVSH
jgi:hypothetical protein